MVGAPFRRLHVAFARSRELSQRWACALFSNFRSSSITSHDWRPGASPLLMVPWRVLVRRIRASDTAGSTCPWNVWVMSWLPRSSSDFGSKPGRRCLGSGLGNEWRHHARTAFADGSKRTLGLRFCLRRLRKRSADQVPDRGGRIYA